MLANKEQNRPQHPQAIWGQLLDCFGLSNSIMRPRTTDDVLTIADTIRRRCEKDKKIVAYLFEKRQAIANEVRRLSVIDGEDLLVAAMVNNLCCQPAPSMLKPKRRFRKFKQTLLSACRSPRREAA